MSEKIIATIVIGIIGIGLTLSRRYNNSNISEAGLGIAGWTIVTLLLMWI